VPLTAGHRALQRNVVEPNQSNDRGPTFPAALLRSALEASVRPLTFSKPAAEEVSEGRWLAAQCSLPKSRAIGSWRIGSRLPSHQGAAGRCQCGSPGGPKQSPAAELRAEFALRKIDRVTHPPTITAEFKLDWTGPDWTRLDCTITRQRPRAWGLISEPSADQLPAKLRCQ
jgi:hypothetical protein